MSSRTDQERRAVRYYEERLAEHGETARGVDWSSEESQHQRFTQLLKIIDLERPKPLHGRQPSVNDFGCGYGALLPELRAVAGDARYVGFDLAEAMVRVARTRFAEDAQASFTSAIEEVPVADYTVASGVFNVRQGAAEHEWWLYVQELIADMARLSRRGFAFNVLTGTADRELKRSDLFYADPPEVLRLCQSRYSRWVSLLHDYGLYEFTVLVRSEKEGAWQT